MLLSEEVWHRQLAKVIISLKTPDYPPTLVSALQHIVPFDFSEMFAFRGETPPLGLFDNFGAKRRQIFVKIYQERPFLLDPFYQACRDRKPPGVYRLRELAPDRFYQSEYFRSYYVRTGLSEEIGFLVALPNDVRVVMSLMRAGNRPGFSEREMNRLRVVEPLLRALTERHWDSLFMRFSETTGKREQAILEKHLDYTFRNFGRSVLTARESEVVGLVLRGHSSDSISKILGIAAGTVKIHRKNIYTKLGISSQTELFSLFISSLSEPSEILPGASSIAAE